jgi:hypothetical protein
LICDANDRFRVPSSFKGNTDNGNIKVTRNLATKRKALFEMPSRNNDQVADEVITTPQPDQTLPKQSEAIRLWLCTADCGGLRQRWAFLEMVMISKEQKDISTVFWNRPGAESASFLFVAR